MTVKFVLFRAKRIILFHIGMTCFRRKFFRWRGRCRIILLAAAAILITNFSVYHGSFHRAKNKHWRRFQNNLLGLRLARSHLDLSGDEDGTLKNYKVENVNSDQTYRAFGKYHNLFAPEESVVQGHDIKSPLQDQLKNKNMKNVEADSAVVLQSHIFNSVSQEDEEINPYKKLAPWQEESIITPVVRLKTKIDSEPRLSPFDSTDEKSTGISKKAVANTASTEFKTEKREETGNAKNAMERKSPQSILKLESNKISSKLAAGSESRIQKGSEMNREFSQDEIPRQQIDTEKSAHDRYSQQSYDISKVQKSKESRKKHLKDPSRQEQSQDSSREEQSQDTPRQEQSQNARRQEQYQNTPRKEQSRDTSKNEQSQDTPKQEQSQDAPRQEQSQNAPKQEHSQDTPGQEQSQNTPRKEQSQDTTRQKHSQDTPKKEQYQDTPRHKQSQDTLRHKHSQDTPRKKQSQNTSRQEQSQGSSKREITQERLKGEQIKEAAKREQSQKSLRRGQSQDALKRERSQEKPKIEQSLDTPKGEKTQHAPQRRKSNNSKIHTSAPERAATENRCQPRNRVMFLKTHRTAGSTVTNILNRFGDKHDLLFAVPGNGLNRFMWPGKFQSKFVNMSLLSSKNGKADILCNHAVYSRRNLEVVMPKDTYYITILRHPMLHFESSFFYLEFPRICKINGTNNHEKMRNFFQHPEMYLKSYLKKKGTEEGRMIKNGMVFDLGLPFEKTNDMEFVHEYIKRLEKEFDLVLIAEQFDESLVMLKRELCWNLEDVAYFRFLELEDEPRELPPDIFNRVLDWNQGDVMLYSYFSWKFNERLKKEGPDFHEEVKQLQQMNELLKERCLLETYHREAFKTNVQIQEYKVNADLKGNERKDCCRMMRDEVNYIKYHRVKQNFKLKDRKRLLDYFDKCQ